MPTSDLLLPTPENYITKITVDEYIIWRANSYNDETGEEEEPCGVCAELDGQIFHISEIPPVPHDNCKCGAVPLAMDLQFREVEARLDKLEADAERERKKKEALDKFKKSEQLDKNIKEAERMQGQTLITKYLWMKENFPTGAKYDIKYDNPDMEHTGNFNYGVMGGAAGLSEFELKAAAGVYQVWSKTSDIDFVMPWSWSFGDDPIDQQYIQEGIDYYDENYGE